MLQELNRDIGRMFDLMSPSTLAALIHDIEELGTGADSAALDIERAAREALVANCGEADAARYLAPSLMDRASELTTEFIYPATVRFDVQWPSSVMFDGATYVATGKTGCHRHSGFPSAEYGRDNRRIWLLADGSIFED